MTPYTVQNEIADRERIMAALDELNAIRERYKDVIAIPEVVTLHDITNYRLDTSKGPRQFQKAYDRATAVAVLEYFAGTDYISPELFENTIVCALQDYKQTKRG
jgi:hypothetical protein